MLLYIQPDFARQHKGCVNADTRINGVCAVWISQTPQQEKHRCLHNDRVSCPYAEADPCCGAWQRSCPDSLSALPPLVSVLSFYLSVFVCHYYLFSVKLACYAFRTQKKYQTFRLILLPVCLYDVVYMVCVGGSCSCMAASSRYLSNFFSSSKAIISAKSSSLPCEAYWSSAL